MAYAIRVHENGGPEVLKSEEISVPAPAANEVLLRQTAVGLNFIDVYYRTGLYPAPDGLPFIPGNEAAGVVEAVGANVQDLKVGDRVAYAGPLGSYASHRVIAADRLVKVPDAIADETAAAIMLQGMTAEYLICRTYKVKAGDTILCHAAAGGVGLLLGQWAKHIGATVIGTVGSEEKAKLARAHGYDHVINYNTENFVERVREITKGALCNVVYDSVGQTTFEGSLDCLRPLGMFVSFGQSSGPIPPFDLAILSKKGSLFATRPTLFVYNAKREDLVESANELFKQVASGVVKVNINQRYPLADAAKAHADLEARKTTGKTILTV